MPVEITAVHPEKICFLSSKTVELLKSAHNPFFGTFDALEKARESRGVIYEIRQGDAIIGAFFLQYLHNHLGKVMDLVYLGGELDRFKTELSQFLWDLAENQRVNEFTYMGRKGFAKLFPWLQEVTTVYRCHVLDKG